MIHVECPWCAEQASLELDEATRFVVCAACTIRVDLAGDPIAEDIARAA